MKNTLIPLSIAFFDRQGVILRILDMEPCRADPCPVYYPGVVYQGALEVNQGWFRRRGLKEGARVGGRGPQALAQAVERNPLFPLAAFALLILLSVFSLLGYLLAARRYPGPPPPTGILVETEEGPPPPQGPPGPHPPRPGPGAWACGRSASRPSSTSSPRPRTPPSAPRGTASP
jgi:hypothetical protein